MSDHKVALDHPAECCPNEEQFISAAMDWHFSPATGTPFWLDRRTLLDFDPRRDIRTHADLRLFPNLVNHLRDVPIGDLVPRGYEDSAESIGVYESGGTTGNPKRVVLLADWIQRYTTWASSRMDGLGFPPAGDWLAVTPTGPHIFGRIVAELAHFRRGFCFTIDLDPRWVRKCLSEGRHDEAERYAEYLVDQAAVVLNQQKVDVLVVTPPLLERIARRDDLVARINTNTRTIMWGGAHLDADTRRLLQTEVFPSVSLYGMYGSTMILGGGLERPAPAGEVRCVFDAFSPYITFDVVDPVSRIRVNEGERGQVVMHHVSRSLLLPNNLERDLATKVTALRGALGVSVADVMPVSTFEDTTVVEGVY